MFEGEAYAFPFAALYHTPVVLQSEHDQHIALFWSPQGNRAMAFNVSRELKSRDLDVVSMPANALLVYNTRLGEFINGLTGLTLAGKRRRGSRIVCRQHARRGRSGAALHPQTHVMLPTTRIDNAPHQPVMPVPSNASFSRKLDRHSQRHSRQRHPRVNRLPPPSYFSAVHRHWQFPRNC